MVLSEKFDINSMNIQILRLRDPLFFVKKIVIPFPNDVFIKYIKTFEFQHFIKPKYIHNLISSQFYL